MIPAHGYEAIYTHQPKDGPEREATRPVIAWHASTGRPLVVDPDAHELVPAHTVAGFKGVREAAAPVTYVPGGGWMSNYLTANGQRRTAPIVAWGIGADGRVEPVIYYDTDLNDDEVTKIWHPDHGQTRRAG